MKSSELADMAACLAVLLVRADELRAERRRIKAGAASQVTEDIRRNGQRRGAITRELKAMARSWRS